MKPIEPHIPSLIGLDGRLFFVGMGFLFAGLLGGYKSDFDTGDPWISLVDGLTFLVYAVFLYLGWKRIISYNAAFLICLIQTSCNFISGELLFSLLHQGRSMLGNANPQLLLLSGVFGIIAGVAISRWASLIFGFVGLILLSLFALTYKNSIYYQHWFGLFVFIIAGNAMNKFYYRHLLEKLVRQLDDSLAEVGSLKNQAEELHELNQPSVIFGQHTTALVADFMHDVVVLETGLEAVRTAPNLEASSRQVDIMTESILNLNRRIEWVKFVSSATPYRTQELLPIGQVLESAIYPFRLKAVNRDRISFVLDPIAPVGVHGYRRWLLQMIENLMTLICDSGATRVRFNLELEKPSSSASAAADLWIYDDGSNLQDRLLSKEYGRIAAAAGQFPAGFLMDTATPQGISTKITLFNIALLVGSDDRSYT